MKCDICGNERQRSDRCCENYHVAQIHINVGAVDELIRVCEKCWPTVLHFIACEIPVEFLNAYDLLKQQIKEGG